MSNIFKAQKEVNNEPKRNNFDLSFQNHLTMKMGNLYPVFCKEVVPGDSFRISSAFGLKFMPLAFPVQSKMRANMQFFYVRNKNLWSDWENWISGLKGSSDGVVHPYISQPSEFFRTGSLADYLNVPTTLAVGGSAVQPVTSWYHRTISQRDPSHGFDGYHYSACYRPDGQYVSGSPSADVMIYFTYNQYFGDSNYLQRPCTDFEVAPCDAHLYGCVLGWFREPLYDDTFTLHSPNEISPFNNNVRAVLVTRPYGEGYSAHWTTRLSRVFTAHEIEGAIQDGNYLNVNIGSTLQTAFNHYIAEGLECAIFLCFDISDVSYKSSYEWQSLVFDPTFYVTLSADSVNQNSFSLPFDHTQDAIRISALPFRAYESIIRCYFKNPVVQPLVVNGEEKYNQYNTTTAGGADSTPYHLEKRNYELDFLTSALPSPQQGNAPLVGFNKLTGTITLTSDDGITTATADVDNAGNITGLNVTSPIAGKDHALTLAQIATSGMSINDFRNTNALQRWLETNIRKGYRYLDFIAGHFGVTPEYRELDMPEFIGGFSQNVTVSQIVSSSDTLIDDGDNTRGASLGQYVGMANCFGGSENTITHYCDDYGFIIGILSVVPTPAYSQLLPKHFLKHNPLDYYFSEFSELGMQPITYEEVCPIQAYNEFLINPDKKLTDTFGYQRPNYDLVSNVDEIHGQFRGSLHNFLINRVFGSRPILGDDFLQIDPDETNQIFIDQSPDSDNIIGQVIFDVKAKRPIPRVVIPSLGR